MLNFINYITEGISSSNLPKANLIIQKYLKKNTGLALFSSGVEEFRSSKGRGFGVRYFFPKKRYSVRFNWEQSTAGSLANVKSITFWNGREPTPYIITYDEPVSLVKILPIIVDIIKGGGKITDKTVYTLPDDVPLNESFFQTSKNNNVLTEAVKFELPEILDGVLELVQTPSFAKGKVFSMYKSSGLKIFDELERRYSNLITKQGVKYVWTGNAADIKKIQSEKDSILKAIGAVQGTVTRGAATEEYDVDQSVVEIESNMLRKTFELQLKDLENLTKLTISGASNALFIAGKGGCLSGDTLVNVT